MKRLFLFLFAAVLGISQMWGASVSAYVCFPNQEMRAMGKAGVGTSNPPTIGFYSAVAGYTSVTVASGTTVYWKAVAEPGYQFDGWSTSYTYNSGLSTAEVYSESITAKRELYAWFSKASTDVTVSVALANGCTGMGTVSGGKTCAAGTSMTITASANSGYYFKGWSKNADGSAIESTLTSYTISASATTYYAVFGAYKTSSVNPSSATNEDWSNVVVPTGFVDLGLPSGKLWSIKDLGAGSEYGSGYLYAWGSKTGKSTSSGYKDFTYANYDATTLTSTYTGQSAYDPATANDANTYTPTTEDWQELMNYATWEWNSGSNKNYTVSGNGNSITLYASGYADGSNYMNATSCCYYWSSTYYKGSGNTKEAYYFLGYNNGSNQKKVTYQSSNKPQGYAHHGMKVRPVRNGVGTACTLTIVAKCGTTTLSTSTFKCDPGEQVQITANDAAGVYSFKNWQDNSSTNATRVFTVSSSTSVTVNYEQAVTYVSAVFYNDDKSIFKSYLNSVPSGTTPDDPGTPSKPQDNTYTYTFNDWNPALGNITENTEYYPQFTPVYRNYSVTFRTSASDESPTVHENLHFDAPLPSKPTLTIIEIDGGMFEDWYLVKLNGDTIEENQTAYEDCEKKVKGNMVFEPRFADYDNMDTITVKVTGGQGKVTLTYAGQTYTKNTDEGNSKQFIIRNATGRLVAVATPARGYHVVGDASKMLQQLRTTEISFTFAANTPLDLIENHDNTNYNDTLVENHKTQFLSVSVMTNQTTPRSIEQGYWATIYMPFDYTVTPEDDFYDQVYALVGGSVDANNIATLNFVKQTKLTAYVPYLITAKNKIEKLFFDGVKLTSFQGKSLFIEAGNVDFIGTLSTGTVTNKDANNKTNFYIANSAAGVSLKYASANGATLYGYRAYFSKNNNAGVAGAPARRAIVDLDGEEYEMVITEDGDIVPANQARKYIQNGQLIIERDGVKYNTLGAIAE